MSIILLVKWIFEEFQNMQLFDHLNIVLILIVSMIPIVFKKERPSAYIQRIHLTALLIANQLITVQFSLLALFMKNLCIKRYSVSYNYILQPKSKISINQIKCSCYYARQWVMEYDRELANKKHHYIYINTISFLSLSILGCIDVLNVESSLCTVNFLQAS